MGFLLGYVLYKGVTREPALLSDHVGLLRCASYGKFVRAAPDMEDASLSPQRMLFITHSVDLCGDLVQLCWSLIACHNGYGGSNKFFPVDEVLDPLGRMTYEFSMLCMGRCRNPFTTLKLINDLLERLYFRTVLLQFVCGVPTGLCGDAAVQTGGAGWTCEPATC